MIIERIMQNVDLEVVFIQIRKINSMATVLNTVKTVIGS